MRKILVAAVCAAAVCALAALSGPALAKTPKKLPGQLIACSLQPSKHTGALFSEAFAFGVDGPVAVIGDPLSMRFNNGQPVQGRVTEDTAKKLVVSWSSRMTSRSGQQTVMLYRAAWFRSTGKVTVTAKPSGYSNAFEARGICSAEKG